MSENRHYFIGIHIPEQLAHQIKKDIDLRSGLSFHKWTAPDDYHVTLIFLGAIPNERLEKVIELLEILTNEASVFSLELNEVGYFGEKDRPRVFFAKPNENGALMQLREKVKDAVLSAGHPVEKRPFHPHMTIARKWNADHSYVNQAPLGKDPYVMEVSRITLFEIRPKETPRYHAIKQFILHT
ncbi:RNA 2',3'-cyclic phosphodiesterase [Bacillus pumilus]|uniref:RNA 2',3'-cyclic phosphodiesterase n=1 Tax=Bacillus pumilus TaxID=1408 RepID=UPI0011E8BA7B|nr:RNA 2',3'-cyclic phosphodiesterase [Bacillus pumilus]TYS34052.1 RNA 2',3'-cyclic phosphodiesterase [Bacillus pumilus]TYS49103.1 RNA 2',3'-cyclic phosphodiesterase [Bacillus pumilus]